MTLYTSALFLHVIGLIALFGGLVLVQNGRPVLLRAASWEEARSCLALLRSSSGAVVGAALSRRS